MSMYKQPKSVPVLNVAGYPETGVNNDDILVKGKYPPGTKVKTFSTMRGAGAAVKGKKFREATPKQSDK